MGTLRNFLQSQVNARRLSLRASFVAYLAVAVVCAMALSLVTLFGIGRAGQAVYDESYGPRPDYVYNAETGTLMPARDEAVSHSPEYYAAVYLPDLTQAAREVPVEDLRPAPGAEEAFSVQGDGPSFGIESLRLWWPAADGNRQAMDDYYLANWESFVRWLTENPDDPEVRSYVEALGTMPRSVAEARALFAEAFGSEQAAPFDFFFTSMYTDADLTVLKVLDLLAVLLPLGWCAACFLVAGNLFYRRRLAKPVMLLEDAAGRIAQENLDFTVTYESRDEMGRLAQSFETMRASLEASQRQLWQTAEERKRLNAAFAHDLRTPLMVLRGRVELLAQQACDGALSPETAQATSATLLSQVERLEQYVEIMGNLQRLEDRAAAPKPVNLAQLVDELSELATMLANQAGKSVEVSAETVGPEEEESGEEARFNNALSSTELALDAPLVLEVAENLLANALRYAAAGVRVRLRILLRTSNDGTDSGIGVGADDTMPTVDDVALSITVEDDGPGFTPEALAHACDPFYTSTPDSIHLGAGLAIAKSLCEKHSGNLTLANNPEGGATASATFGRPS